MRLKNVFSFIKAPRKLAAMNTTAFQFALLDLPTELIAQIVEHVEGQTALKHLARTCKRIQELTEPLIYRYALIRDGNQMRNMLNSVVASRPARAKAIHELDVPCMGRTTPFYRDLSLLLENARSLKRLMIESPECNTGDFEDEATYKQIVEDLFEPFEKAIGVNNAEKLPLQKLQELVLHLNGPESPYWNIDNRSISLFQLPSLQRLTLSCVNIEDDLASIQARSFTSLKHLTLEESNITHKGLICILSLPKALESLYLGENCHNLLNFDISLSPEVNHLFRTDPVATLQALRQQKDSLKTLTYVATQYYRSSQVLKAQHSPVDAGFAEFLSLETITLKGQCTNFERAVMSSRSPPGLKLLVFQTDGIFWPPFSKEAELNLNEVPFWRAPSCSVPPSLSTMQIIGRDQDFTATLKRVIISVAKKMQQAGVGLEVQVETRSTYFPPYLYGEPLPKTTTVFAGEWKHVARRPSNLMNLLTSFNDNEESSSDSSDEE